MRTRPNRRDYLREFWTRHKRVTLTLSLPDYHQLETRAKAGGRTSGQQLWAESQGYLSGNYVPTALMEKRLQEISLLLRNEANNLNQLTRHSHTLRRLVCDERFIILTLQNQERAVDNMIKQSWHPPRSPQV